MLDNLLHASTKCRPATVKIQSLACYALMYGLSTSATNSQHVAHSLELNRAAACDRPQMSVNRYVQYGWGVPAGTEPY